MHRRITPDLRRQRVMRQLVGQVRILLRKTHGDRAGDAAARLAIIDVLGREVDESAIAELEAEVGGNLLALAVAVLLELAIACDYLESDIVTQSIIQHAGDGVRPVLRRRTIAQHFEFLDGDRGYRREIRSVGPERQTRVSAVINLDQRRSVVSLAVEQDQDLVRRQAPQRRRTNECRGVGNRVLTDVERRDEVPHRVEHVGRGLRVDIGPADDVDRGGRIGHAAIVRRVPVTITSPSVGGLIIVGSCPLLRALSACRARRNCAHDKESDCHQARQQTNVQSAYKSRCDHGTP